MSFNDDPIVDNASKNSEESVNTVRNILTQKNGFIRRKEDPDFGVDEDVELIINNQASSKKFAVQIKSVEKIKIIKKDNKEYLSLQFKSSRLGYLCRRPPAYGIIIIYDDSTKIPYFEYVEKIYQSLNDQHGDESWKQKDKPSINIPIENILNDDAIKTLYLKMIERHKNNQLLLVAHGDKYRIPVHDDKIINNEIDFNNPKHITKFLTENGLQLLDYSELNSINYLISRLTISDILSSKELILLASIINCEIGNFIDADYYLKKSELIEDYDEDQKNLRFFTRFKTDFVFGNFDNKIFLSKLENLLSTISENYNSLIIKINIIFLKLLISTEEKRFTENLIHEIDQVFGTIFSLKTDNKKKYNLINYHAFNLHMYSMGMLIDKMEKLQIQKSLNISVPIIQRVNEVKKIIEILGLPTKYTLEALTFANENDDKYIRATSLYQLSHYFFMLQLSLFNFDQITPLSKELESIFKTNIQYSLNSFDEFSKLSIKKAAFNSLILSYEISLLFKICYKNDLGAISSDKISEMIKSMTKELGLKDYDSTVLSAYSAKQRKQGNDFQSLLSSNENQLEQIAEKLISAIGLPQERKINVLIDLENHQYFFKNRKSDNLELLQDLRHTLSRDTYYKEKPDCLILCKKCGFKTKTGNDIKELMTIIDKHRC
jgi:hypothetical protein